MVRRIMRLCSCLWGGRYNPIIPFFEDTPTRWLERHQRLRGLDIARGYIEFFEPDVLVETLSGMGDKLQWHHDQDHFELPRLAALDDFFEIDSRKRVNFVAGCDIFNVIVHLYNHEFKYQRRHKRPFALIEPGNDSFYELFGGAYPSDDALKYIADGYRDVFEPETLPASSSSFTKYLQEGYAGPSWVTRHALQEANNGHRGPTIFVLDPQDPQDVIDAWNYRLIERNAIPVNLGWLPDHAEFLRDRIKANHRPIPGNPFGTMFHTNLEFARSISGEVASDSVARHFAGLPEHSVLPGSYPTMWEVRTDRYVAVERKIIVHSNNKSFDEEISADGYARVPTIAPAFDDQGELYTRATWMNVITPNSDYRNQDIALVFPSNLWKPRFPRLQTSHRLTITREGWIIPERHAIGYSLLRPITGREAIIEWFDTQGLKATPSEAGQIASQVISAAGSLLACGMFADRETVQLLNSMAESHSGKRRDGKLIERTVPDRAKHRNEIEQHFAKRARRSFGFWNGLEFFLERSVFRAGLRVQCPICTYYNWFDVDEISYKPNCTRCLKEFGLGQSPDNLRSYQWFYRVIGPFAAPDYVRGGYAVALTLRCLAERHESELTWSTGLELKELDCEIDFAGWYRRGSVFADKERDEPAFFVGEAKSFARSAIARESIDTLRVLGERFPGVFLVVSTLKPIADYSTEELELLKGLAMWGRARHVSGKPRNPLIVLTGMELLSDRGISHTWRTDGTAGSKFAHHSHQDLTDLYQLAESTQQLYLGLPPFYADFNELRLQRGRLIRALRHRSKFYCVSIG
jgi:hypothetical protein